MKKLLLTILFFVASHFSYGQYAETVFPATSVSTSGTTSAFNTNVSWGLRGALFFVDVTSLPGGDTVTIALQAYDQTSSTWNTLATAGHITATGVTVYSIDADITGAFYKKLPFNYRLSYTLSAGTTTTFSIGVSYLN